jgi:hypothetical protein
MMSEFVFVMSLNCTLKRQKSFSTLKKPVNKLVWGPVV